MASCSPRGTFFGRPRVPARTMRRLPELMRRPPRPVCAASAAWLAAACSRRAQFSSEVASGFLGSCCLRRSDLRHLKSCHTRASLLVATVAGLSCRRRRCVRLLASSHASFGRPPAADPRRWPAEWASASLSSNSAAMSQRTASSTAASSNSCWSRTRRRSRRSRRRNRCRPTPPRSSRACSTHPVRQARQRRAEGGFGRTCWRARRRPSSPCAARPFLQRYPWDKISLDRPRRAEHESDEIEAACCVCKAGFSKGRPGSTR